MKANIIKELSPLENPKKDFSHVMQSLIDQEEVNSRILNNIKNKKQNTNSNEKDNVNTNFNTNVANKVNSLKNVDLKRLTTSNNDKINDHIKLTRQNDFRNEKREDKNEIMLINKEYNSQRTRYSSQVGKIKTQSTQNTKKPMSILDYIKKSSESCDSAYDSKGDKILNEGLDKIEEISEEMFSKDKKNNPNKKRKNIVNEIANKKFNNKKR